MSDLNTQLANYATTLQLESDRRKQQAKQALIEGQEQAGLWPEGEGRKGVLDDAKRMSVLHEQASVALAKKAKAAQRGVFMIDDYDLSDMHWLNRYAGLYADCREERRVEYVPPMARDVPTGDPTGTSKGPSPIEGR